MKLGNNPPMSLEEINQELQKKLTEGNSDFTRDKVRDGWNYNEIPTELKPVEISEDHRVIESSVPEKFTGAFVKIEKSKFRTFICLAFRKE